MLLVELNPSSLVSLYLHLSNLPAALVSGEHDICSLLYSPSDL